jgi:hypothetical protein
MPAEPPQPGPSRKHPGQQPEMGPRQSPGQPSPQQPRGKPPGARQPGGKRPGARQPGGKRPGARQPGVEPSGAQQPEAEQFRGGGLEQVQWVFAPGSVVDGVEVSGPVPPEMLPGCAAAGDLPGGLDWQALMEALAAGGKLSGDPEGVEEAAAEAEGRMGAADPAELAAMAVEHMAPGPALGGWLEVAAAAVDRLDEDQLTGLAIAARKQASRAHGVELAAVGQLTARAAAADPQVGLAADGRPAQLTRDAAAQIEMALMVSHNGAQALADLAITLTWRLPRTGALLAAGWLDLDRARLIAQYTAVLAEDKAREVEAKILPVARGLPCAQLRHKLTRLVIAVDPRGAEQRRKDAERNAEVRLYADEDQTATLIASKLPQIQAAAGYARINALARARKAAGLPGTLAQHGAHVLLELMLGTLDLIPPADGAPPDQSPPDDDTPPPDAGPGPASGPAPDDSPAPNDSADDCVPGPDRPREDLPEPRDEDAPEDDGLDNAECDPAQPRDRPECQDDLNDTGAAPAWPRLGTIPPALARPARNDRGTPPAGLLDLTLRWTTYARLADQPGTLGRIGAITADQARELARAAEHDPAAQWRIIVTDGDGHAITVTRIRRRARRRPPGPASRDGPRSTPTSWPQHAGLTGRVTLIISDDTITSYRPARRIGPASGAGPPSGARPPGGIAGAALTAAARALQRARDHAQADAAVGGCAHASASPGYRPPPRLREHVIARDLTCRNPVCGQPAWRADLDHTIAWDQGGPTCPCNLGGACRRDHQLKQHPRWKLEQTRPGWFRWTAPSGRTYMAGPESYPI